MSVEVGFSDVGKIEIGEVQAFNTGPSFSARQVTLRFLDGSEYRFPVYGEITGIPVEVREGGAGLLQAAI